MMQTVSAKLNLVRQPRQKSLQAAILLAAVLCGIAVPTTHGFQMGGLQGGTPVEQLTELLQKRVREFYSLIRRRQISQAEQYATKESRERLRDQVSNPFLAFRIASIEVDPEGQSATAVVELTVMVAFATAPIPIQRTTKWKIEDGEWRVEVPEPPPVDSQGGLGLEGLEAPKPEELKFEGHTFGLGVMQSGDVKEARFPFENSTDHVVTIKEIATNCKCLQGKAEKMEYQPGEKGEVVVSFDSTNYDYAFMDTVVVITSPGDVKSYLRIGAQVIPSEFAVPKETPKATQE